MGHSTPFIYSIVFLLIDPFNSSSPSLYCPGRFKFSRQGGRWVSLFISFSSSSWTSQCLTWIFHTSHKRSPKLDPGSNIGFHGAAAAAKMESNCWQFQFSDWTRTFELFQENAPSMKFVHLHPWEISSWAMRGESFKKQDLDSDRNDVPNQIDR